ncbi:MAG: transposase [Bryobacteraceae bacterium]
MAFRSRYLPHVHEIGHPLFITFRLHGSLHRGRYFAEGEIDSGKAFAIMDRLLDSERFGPLYLKMPTIAEIVSEALRRRAGRDYDLHAWVLMANHVHLLLTPRIDFPQLMQRIKGVTARQANLILHLTGTRFRQHESYDRLVRGPEEFVRIHRYIIMNSVRAGIVQDPAEYRWSSEWGKL